MDYDFTVLGRAAAAAESFQGAGQRLHIGLGTDESAYHGHGLATASVLFHTQAQFLLLGWQEFLLRLIIGLIVEQLRKDLDEKIQEVKNLPPSRERSICITKLQEAVMWLGMDLKRLNAENPYPSSKDPSTGDKIEPTADGLKF